MCLSKQDLRCLAEAVITGKGKLSLEVVAEMTQQDTQLLFHELRVHQIELEMQNEELRQTQAALDAEKARYFDLYELAPVGFCTVSQPGLILQANLTAATLLGVTRSELLKKPFSNFIYREDQDSYYFLRQKQITQGAPAVNGDVRLLKKDSTPFWVNLAVSSVQELDGAPVLRMMLKDVSVRKQLEAENLKMLEDALQKVLRLAHAHDLDDTRR
jgi:PAS domain S-box-containing protein